MDGHSIAISGLEVARKGLEVIGNNIANAATEGYHRQEMIVSPIAGQGIPGMTVGQGAEVTDIRRAGNTLLDREIWRRQPELAQADQELATLSLLESILGDLTVGGLSSAIDDFFAALHELASQPDSSAFRQQVVVAADALAAQFRLTGTSLRDLRTQLVHEAQEAVGQINDLAQRVADANAAIQNVRALGSSDNNLVDQRDQALTELADLIGLNVTAADDGSCTVHVSDTPIVLKTHLTPLEVDYTSDGLLGVSVQGAAYYDTACEGGQLGAILALYNTLLPAVQDDLDTLATTLIQRVNRYHVEGLGAAGPFADLEGLAMANDPVGQWNPPVTAGDIHVRGTNTQTGQVTRHTVTVSDPSTETLADIAAGFDAIPGLSATITDARLRLSADAGFAFDFQPVVSPEPAGSTLSGTAAPTLAGVWQGEANETLTATVVGTGEVGVASGLAIEVRDEAGQLLRSLNVGVGYAAGDVLEIANGLTVSLSHGTLNAGEQFTVEALARSDPTGFLAAAGINTLFAGTSAETMEVVDRLRDSSACLAGSLGTEGLDNLNMLRMAGIGDEAIEALGGTTAADAFRTIASDIGHEVSLREARHDGLQSLVEELNRQRDDLCGVDVNEEAALLLVMERQFQGMAKYLSAIDRAQQYLMDLV